MQDFDVAMERVEYRRHTFRVKADTPAIAESIARKMSKDYDWANSSTYHADEEL